MEERKCRVSGTCKQDHEEIERNLVGKRALSVLAYAMVMGFGFAFAYTIKDIIDRAVGVIEGGVSIMNFIPLLIYMIVIMFIIFLISRANWGHKGPASSVIS